MIRIENKTGISRDTKIIDTETGNEIKSVYAIEIMPFDCKSSLIKVKLTLSRVELDIIAEEKP